MVGTNTIRQNYSRIGSLDYILANGGEMFSAVSTMKWSGEAVVFVSIACWRNGKYNYEKELYTEDKSDLIRHVLNNINSSLSLSTDVSKANVLQCNRKPKKVFQGQTHGHEGFLLSKAEGIKSLKQHPEYIDVLKPFLIGEELVGNYNAQPSRFVIDFTFKNQIEASTYKLLFERLKKTVLPSFEAKAREEEKGITKDNGRRAQLQSWWRMWRRREDFMEILHTLKKYIASSRVATRIFFEFISSEINPNDALICFALEDDYSFGVIQSAFHIEWYKAKCSTLKGDYRYTTDSVWDTFPWPQNPREKQIRKVADAAKALHTERTIIMQHHHMSLRDLYRLVEQLGKNPIKDLHTVLDKAVAEAYGLDAKQTTDTNYILQNLLQLNLKVSAKEKASKVVTVPGLPPYIKSVEDYVSEECVRFEWE